jgi:hypothetical protein
MLKRSAVFVLTLAVLLPATVFAKPKIKVYNNAPDEVFTAALKTARERQVVTFTDEKNLMFTFETGTSALSYGFVANASVEPEGAGQAKLTINVQQKNVGMNASFSFNAGDRMADKFFDQVAEKLANASKQPVATRPEVPRVDVPPPTAGSKDDAGDKGTVTVASTPDGCDVSVDGAFVGSAPAILKLSPGKHIISVSQNGYQTWSKDLTVMSGSDVKLNATLPK